MMEFYFETQLLRLKSYITAMSAIFFRSAANDSESVGCENPSLPENDL